MTDEELHELAAAYALGALDPQQKAEYEAYLARSADARAEAASLADAAAGLGLAAEPVRPSAALRASLLAQIAVTPQLAALDAEAAAPAAVAPAAAVAAPAPAEPRGAEAEARSRWFRRPAAMLVAAAAAVLLFFGGVALGTSIRANDFAVTQATALASLQAASDAQQAQATMEGGGTATLIWSLEQRRSAVMIDEMPELPEGKTYQLWYIGEDGPVADGTFEPADSGKTWRVLDGLMTGGDAVGITVEPEGGSPEPTTDPVVVIASA
jgi:anti-sigma-K factor RskA